MTIFAPPAHGPDSATQLTRLLENLTTYSNMLQTANLMLLMGTESHTQNNSRLEWVPIDMGTGWAQQAKSIIL